MKITLFSMTVFSYSVLASLNGFCQELKENKRQIEQLVKQVKATATQNSSVESPVIRQITLSQKQSNITYSDVRSTPIVEVFIPIPAERYTDENYIVNLQKSREQEALLNASNLPPYVICPPDVQVEKYKVERDKYPVGSYEYETIQEKINQFQGN